jgi:very-short-patch-repair endonuclease
MDEQGMPRKIRGKTNAQTVHLAREQRRKPTPAEEKLWDVLRARRLAGLKFRRQHPLGPYILDYFCVEHQLEVEVDGGIHNEPEQIEHDERRAEYLNKHGIQILRFTNTEIEKHLDQVLQKIIDAANFPSSDAGFASGEGARG